MAGRGLRIFEGKENCTLIDHGGCVDEHGLIEWPRTWTLEGKKKAWSKAARKESDPKVVQCRGCKLCYIGGGKCPDCGTEPISFGKKINCLESDLQPLKKEKVTQAEKRRWFGMLLWYVRHKGWNEGAAAHRYRDKFGVWPRGMKGMCPIEPDNAFMSYQKHLMIRYAKSKQKRA